jgi:L-threonylcarbamoyladenylate synthase
MKVVPFNQNTLKEAVLLLKNGGVIAHPADTCFGLTCDLMNPKAVEKIQAIKGRDFKKPMSVMISVAEQLNLGKYAKMNDFSSSVARKLFPGAVTLLLPKGLSIPEHFFPRENLIGLRMPMHELTQDILIAFNGPLITTSANPSGKDICFTHEEVFQYFNESEYKPDIVFEGRSNKHNLASTVIEVKRDSLKIIRKGPMTVEQLKSILGVDVEE